MRMLIRRLRHYFGRCHKAKLGYSCHGADNFRECGTAVKY